MAQSDVINALALFTGGAAEGLFLLENDSSFWSFSSDSYFWLWRSCRNRSLFLSHHFWTESSYCSFNHFCIIISDELNISYIFSTFESILIAYQVNIGITHDAMTIPPPTRIHRHISNLVTRPLVLVVCALIAVKSSFMSPKRICSSRAVYFSLISSWC